MGRWTQVPPLKAKRYHSGCPYQFLCKSPAENILILKNDCRLHEALPSRISYCSSGSDVLSLLERMNTVPGAWHAATDLVNALIFVLIGKQAAQEASIHIAWTDMLIYSPQGLHSLTCLWHDIWTDVDWLNIRKTLFWLLTSTVSRGGDLANMNWLVCWNCSYWEMCMSGMGEKTYKDSGTSYIITWGVQWLRAHLDIPLE